MSLRTIPLFWLFLFVFPLLAQAEPIIRVSDDASLRQALRQARAGTHILIVPGRYQPGVYAANLKGTPDQPIVIEGSEPENPPVFEGGSEAWHLSKCAYLTLRHLAVQGQKINGINIDDGGTLNRPTHHIRLEHLQVTDVGPRGNFDAIKLSGVDDFVLKGCTITGWGGQAVDMVGCHRGLIVGCTFRGKPGFSQGTGPQTKGGSSEVRIHRCLFLNAGERAVNLGGSTGLAYFRPQGAKYEARDIRVEGCTFVNSLAPVAFVGVDGAVFRFNTIFQPKRWVVRILQETTNEGFVPCRKGCFERNLIVFRRAELADAVNVGPHTQPETFILANNLWYCQDRPERSTPRLPVRESGGLYGVDPRLAAPEKGQFQPRNPQATPYGASAWPGENKER